MSDLENIFLRNAERLYAGRRHDRHGLVTSYDPKKHLAKVMLQPEGFETGWIPIETNHIGEGYGEAVGLQTGSGMGSQSQGADSGGGGGLGGTPGGTQQANQQAMGDQVIVSFQEGDIDGGKVVKVVHSTKDTPPTVQSGERVLWTKFKQDQNPGPDAAQTGSSGSKGQKIFFKNDGSLNLEDGNGASVFLDGQGNTTHNATKKLTHQILTKRDGTPFKSLSTDDNDSAGTQVHHVTLSSGSGGGSDKAGIVSGVFQDKHQVTLLQQGVTASANNGQHKTTWDQNGVTHTSSTAVTSTAPNIPHNGNTSVSQNLTVSQIISALSFNTTSDVRLKSKISPIRSVLDKVLALCPKTFLKKKVEYDEDGGESISPDPAVKSSGFIAQEIRQIFPDIVKGDETKGYLRVEENRLLPILVAAFQEYVAKTDREIAELKAAIHEHSVHCQNPVDSSPGTDHGGESA